MVAIPVRHPASMIDSRIPQYFFWLAIHLLASLGDERKSAGPILQEALWIGSQTSKLTGSSRVPSEGWYGRRPCPLQMVCWRCCEGNLDPITNGITWICTRAQLNIFKIYRFNKWKNSKVQKLKLTVLSELYWVPVCLCDNSAVSTSHVLAA